MKYGGAYSGYCVTAKGDYFYESETELINEIRYAKCLFSKPNCALNLEAYKMGECYRCVKKKIPVKKIVLKTTFETPKSCPILGTVFKEEETKEVEGILGSFKNLIKRRLALIKKQRDKKNLRNIPDIKLNREQLLRKYKVINTDIFFMTADQIRKLPLGLDLNGTLYDSPTTTEMFTRTLDMDGTGTPYKYSVEDPRNVDD